RGGGRGSRRARRGAGQSGRARSGAWFKRGYAPPVNSNRARIGQEFPVTHAPASASLPALAAEAHRRCAKCESPRDLGTRVPTRRGAAVGGEPSMTRPSGRLPRAATLFAGVVLVAAACTPAASTAPSTAAETQGAPPATSAAAA